VVGQDGGRRNAEIGIAISNKPHAPISRHRSSPLRDLYAGCTPARSLLPMSYYERDDEQDNFSPIRNDLDHFSPRVLAGLQYGKRARASADDHLGNPK
ncbi:hypothetical protein KBI52_01070, partial [Microvirga sp. HBU67558]|uniref:hypothetical protein n=1 Tax=Microvirga sp. HBU67558 TaxID=2824562 RepID=UPI001B35A98A